MSNLPKVVGLTVDANMVGDLGERDRTGDSVRIWVVVGDNRQRLR